MGVCGVCIKQIKRHPEPDCRGAKQSFTVARSVCLYEGALKELVHLFKYKNKRSLAGLFARYMIDFIKEDAAFIEGIELVTFVPLHKKSLRKRDFNQSEMLGRRIAAELGLPIADCLEKIRHTANQNELSRHERLNNLKCAFRVRERSRAILWGRTILLVDDVMTTGATLDECSRTLLAAGAREVRCLALARGI
jgi:ComF family protein